MNVCLLGVCKPMCLLDLRLTVDMNGFKMGFKYGQQLENTQLRNTNREAQEAHLSRNV